MLQTEGGCNEMEVVPASWCSARLLDWAPQQLDKPAARTLALRVQHPFSDSKCDTVKLPTPSAASFPYSTTVAADGC